jgi:hypothetical protein
MVRGQVQSVMSASKRFCLLCGFMLEFLCLIQTTIAETKLTVSSTFDWKNACYEYQ